MQIDIFAAHTRVASMPGTIATQVLSTSTQSAVGQKRWLPTVTMPRWARTV